MIPSRKTADYRHALALAGALLTSAAAGCGGDSKSEDPPAEGCSCSSLRNGWQVTRDPAVDGLFFAVITLEHVTLGISSRFESEFRELTMTFGVESSSPDRAQTVSNLLAAIEEDVAAHAPNGLLVRGLPPRCAADRLAAVEAQALCESWSGCDFDVDPDTAPIACDGLCDGSCDGDCSGSYACRVPVDAATCGGRCEGFCAPAGPQSCAGDCFGACSGPCSAYDIDGACRGICGGECDGTCSGLRDTQCAGECSGSCRLAETDALCVGQIECAGVCDGSCLGECRGAITPGSTSSNCNSAAKCEAQARALASANVGCRFEPFELALDAGVAPDPAFLVRLSTLERYGATILSDYALNSALVEGDFGDDAATAASAIDVVHAEIEDGLRGNVLLVVAREPGKCLECAPAGFAESAEILNDVASTAQELLLLQARLATALRAGFR